MANDLLDYDFEERDEGEEDQVLYESEEFAERYSFEPEKTDEIMTDDLPVLPLRGVVDLERESERLGAEFDRLGELLEAAEARLRNPGFTERAPAEVVQRERDKAESLAERRELLLRKKASFGPLAG